MVLRHREPLPIPPKVIADLQAQISRDHGSTLWTGDGGRFLVARVPGDEPDVVNDVEAVAEFARPSDVDGADRALLVGGRGVAGMPIDTIRDLVVARVRFDRTTAREMRPGLDPQFGNRFFRSPADPKRRLRLAIRIPCDHVADLDDDMLSDLADRVAPRIEQGALRDVHCIYMIAAKDDVRLETEAFADDLLERWRDVSRRRAIVEERERLLATKKLDREEERLRLLGELQARYEKHVAYAPVRSKPRDGAIARPPGASAPAAAQTPVQRVPDSVAARVDALPAPRSLAMTDAEGAAPEAPVEAPEAPARPELPPHLEELAQALEAAGFDVLPRPDVPGHTVHLAAERADGTPNRVIAVATDRFTLADAQTLLDAARDLQVDLAIALADAVEPEAAKRIIATKIKHVRPGTVSHLRL